MGIAAPSLHSRFPLLVREGGQGVRFLSSCHSRAKRRIPILDARLRASTLYLARYFTGEAASSQSDEAVRVLLSLAAPRSSSSCDLIFVSSRPESAEWRDPGFRPRAPALQLRKSRRVRFFTLSLSSLCHSRAKRRIPAPSLSLTEGEAGARHRAAGEGPNSKFRALSSNLTPSPFPRGKGS